MKKLVVLTAMLAMVLVAASPALAQSAAQEQYEGEATLSFKVVTQGEVPEDATFFGLYGPPNSEVSSVQLTDPDGDGTYTGVAGGINGTDLATGEYRVSIEQGTSGEPGRTTIYGPETITLDEDRTVSATASFDDDEEPQTATLRGTITSITSDEVLVEENPNDPTIGEKGKLAVSEETEILRQSDGEVVAVDSSELRVGQQVEATYSGPTQESYPFRAGAERIVILEGDTGDRPPGDPGNGTGDDQYDPGDPGNGDDQYDPGDPGNGSDQYDPSPSDPPDGGDGGASGVDGEGSSGSGSIGDDSSADVSVLPDTGGPTLLTLGVGGLLVAGGLLARRVTR